MSEDLVAEIKAKISSKADPEAAAKYKRYFREPIECLGLSSSGIDEVTRMFYPRVKGNLKLALEVAGALVRTRVLDNASVGIRLMRRMKRRLTPELFDVFDGWVDHLTNWANTDGLRTWLISETVRLDPSHAERLLEWTGSENRWRRRAAAVSLVPIARKGGMLGEAFAIADRLMTNGEDMVQKGVGLLLKEASKEHPAEVRSYPLR
ncbi:MAG: DNA alkylation repair protein [Candidatus Bathyarchaeota archaeon]|nr:MAG: DNA alkylation repair protein [Candidatus Bathyarchaeota archaeon]